MNSSTRAGLSTDLPPPFWLKNRQGMRLAVSEYPAPRPWLHLVVSHGFGEHRGWYHHVAGALREQGISTYTFDHFHHGISDGRPADIPAFGVLTEGLRLVLEQGVGPRLPPGAPLALLGHSNGGLAVIRALGELPVGQVSCVVLSNPLLGLPLRTTLWGAALAGVLGLFAPRLRLPTRPVPERLTGDSTIWPDYDRDPYRFRSISVRFFKAMLFAAHTAYWEANCQGLPLLLLCGERDWVVDRFATRNWFARLESERKKLIAYPTLRHELLNEREWGLVVADIVAWLKQLPAPGGRELPAPGGRGSPAPGGHAAAEEG